MHTINPILFLKKNETEKDRKVDLKFGYVETTRYYSERLNFEFDNEIISEHFGKSWSLSIEGWSAWFFPNPNNMKAKKRDTISLTLIWWIKEKCGNNTYTHASFGSVFDGKNLLIEGGTIFDNTDGHAKQFRCATALHLLFNFLFKKKVCIDR